MIKCGIIGGAGYTAGELIRLLLNHPDAELTFINSSSNAGNKITDVHGGLYGETDLVFTSELPLESIDMHVRDQPELEPVAEELFKPDQLHPRTR